MASIPDIMPVIQAFDVFGALGCDPVQPRVNLLVTCEKVQHIDGKPLLTVMHHSVEGFGINEFWKDRVHMPQDQVLQTQTIQWNVDIQVPAVNQQFWVKKFGDHPSP